MYSAFQRATLSNSTLKKQQIVPESRCTGKAGNAGQWAGRASSAFVLLALFSASVTVTMFTAA